jgi:hypothetical protein
LNVGIAASKTWLTAWNAKIVGRHFKGKLRQSFKYKHEYGLGRVFIVTFHEYKQKHSRSLHGSNATITVI